MSAQGGIVEMDDLQAGTSDCDLEHTARFVAEKRPQTMSAMASLNPACVVCGRENPHGLHLEFESDGGGSTAQWTTSAGWESFKGVIHGGVISAVLDEAMSQAVIGSGYEALTAELKVRFRKKVSVRDVLRVRGWVVNAQRRKIVAEGSLISAGGEEKAHAWATFLVTEHVQS
jgi:hypothetical protein